MKTKLAATMTADEHTTALCELIEQLADDHPNATGVQLRAWALAMLGPSADESAFLAAVNA